MQGSFSRDCLEVFNKLASAAQSFNYRESGTDSYDFTRCVRPNGTAYGASGQCRKGTEEKKQQVAHKATNPEKIIEKSSPRDREPGYKIGVREKTPKGVPGKRLEIGYGSEEEINRFFDEEAKKIRSHASTRHVDEWVAESEKERELTLSRFKSNKDFANRVRENAPKNTKLSVNKDGEIEISTKTRNGLPVVATFSFTSGFNFKVNGEYDAGSTKDRREQLEVALMVRSMYDSIVRSLPVGSVIRTTPYRGDGKGDAREKAYRRVGFSTPDGGGSMYTVKKEGNVMSPSKFSDWEDQEFEKGHVWFAEKSDDSGTKFRRIKDWFTIVTGVNFARQG